MKRLEIDNEVWKQIKDYPGYFASNMGRVKSMKNNKERILKSHRKMVCISKDGHQRNISIKKLMYSAFHDVGLEKLEGVFFLGDNLDTIRPLLMKDFLSEIRTQTRPLMTSEIVEKTYYESFDELRMIIKALKTGDTTELSERVLSCKTSTMKYLHNKFRIKKESAEDIWSEVSSEVLIRIMKKEIVVRDIQGYIIISVRNLYLNKIKQRRNMRSYNDELAIARYK